MKGQVSPHEFMQAVLAASKRRFLVDKQSDPVDFLSWWGGAGVASHVIGLADIARHVTERRLSP